MINQKTKPQTIIELRKRVDVLEKMISQMESIITSQIESYNKKDQEKVQKINLILGKLFFFSSSIFFFFF